MALFSDSYEPSWMRGESKPWQAMIEGIQAGSQIARNIQNARSLDMEAQLQPYRVSQMMAQTEMAKQTLQHETEENRAWMKDAPDLAKWLTLPDDKLDTAPTPEVTSKQGMDLIQKRRAAKSLNDYREGALDVKQNRADNVLEAARIRNQTSATATKDTKDWADAFSRLSKEDRATLQKEVLAQDPQGLDENGFPKVKYRPLINDYLGGEKQLKVGAPKPGTGGGGPEFFTDEATGRRFMRWGNKHYDLSGITPQQRAKIEVAKGDYNRAQREYDKAVENKATDQKKDELLQNIILARDNLDQLTKAAPSTAAPTKSTETGSKTVRVKSPDGKTGTIPADQLEQAKQQGYTPLD